MFSIKKPATMPKSLRTRLASLPDLPTIHHVLAQAMENLGMRQELAWILNDNDQGFVLDVVCDKLAADPIWRLFSGADGRNLLWQHQSCDVLLIHNLVNDSCGNFEQAFRADGAIYATDAYRDKYKNTYYVRNDHAQGESITTGNQKSTGSILTQRVSPGLQHKVVDQKMIQDVMTPLKSAGTGLFTYPAFLYFLEQEFFRSYRLKRNLSIIAVRLRDQHEMVLPPPAMLQAFSRINLLKRQIDLFAHYERNDFALLLPDTNAKGAKRFSGRLIEKLIGEPLAPHFDNARLNIAMGISSLPDDCRNLGQLLSAAEIARNEAELSAKQVLTYAEMQAIHQAS